MELLQLVKELDQSHISVREKAYFDFISRSNDSAALWKPELHLVSKKTNHTIPEHISDPEQINDYFIDSLSAAPFLPFIRLPRAVCGAMFSLSTTDNDTVNAIISKISPNSTGSDWINIQMIHLC